MSLHCRRDECGHDVHGHYPDPPHGCDQPVTVLVAGVYMEKDCACQAFLYDAEVSQGQASLQDLALEEAARHLAGLGRGKFHRVDVEVGPEHRNGKIKLDGVDLRGVTDFEIISSSVDGLTKIHLTMIVSVGQDNKPGH